MKHNYALLSIVLAFALALPVFGQESHNDKTKTHEKHHDVSKMMGKPKVDATVEGLHMKVWLVTQKHHKKMMKENMEQMMKHRDKEEAMEKKGMKDTSMAMGKEMHGMKHHDMGMDKAMMDSMMAGTHHIRLDVTDAASGKKIDSASATVLIESPSKKNSSVDLRPMISHFGGALTLDEKGKYHITVSVNVHGVSKTKEFDYVVK